MNQIIVKSDSKAVNWDANLRFRVGESCVHNGTTWSNITGFNTEPGTTSDWKSIGSSSSTVVVNGNPFPLTKHPDNNDPTKTGELETNDIINNGYWDNAEFWHAARYLGGDKDIIGNWQRLDFTDEIPIT